MTAQRTSVMRYDHGYAFRANIWHNPDMAAAANSSIHAWLNSCNREYMVIRDLNKAWRTHKKITIADKIGIKKKNPFPSPQLFTVHIIATVPAVKYNSPQTPGDRYHFLFATKQTSNAIIYNMNGIKELQSE